MTEENLYYLGTGPLLCDCCGRQLSNDPSAENAARWTVGVPKKLPYCADSDLCKREVYRGAMR